MSSSEIACTYACLILHDDAIPITAEKIAAVLKAANVTVESYWPNLFAKLCEKKHIEGLILNATIGGAGSGSVPVAAADTAPATEEKKKEETKEEESEDEEEMFSLFDD
ncbi:hypothetical protein ACH5RR_017294 [Cinchona calisaya]|uniref:60S acidic ribosomal protein P1 n=1 Tax=Cinchona calisaya TaxID=153742 RepID=A0ABD3A1P8_9GENT